MAKGQTSRIFVWIILGLLIVGLAGFGATSFSGYRQAVGAVGDTEIDIDRYARELQQELRAISAEQGRNVTLREAELLGITQGVLARIVNLAALEDEAAELGLSIGDGNVGRQVLEMPAFQGTDGSFDREAYDFVLERNGLSVAEFEDRVRVETAASIVQNAVVAGVDAPRAYARSIVGFVTEARDVTWARLEAGALAEPLGEPAEADLQAVWEATPERWTLPEARRITYAWVTPDMLSDTIEPDEDLLRALYDERRDLYLQPERRLVERLVFRTDEAAAEALARIVSGETGFEALVEERGLALSDVDLGDVSREDLGAAAEAVFGLSGPGIAGPAPTPLGPALFRVNAVLAAQETTFEEAREELAEEAVIDRARRIISDMLNQVDDLLAGGATLEELAEETELELGEILWTPEVTEGIAAYEGFRAAAAELREGDFPEALELEEGGLFAMRLDEIVPPRLQALDEVRADVRAVWEAEETTRRLSADAEAVAESLRAGREMAALRLPLGTDRDLRRDSFVEGTPGDFVTVVFEMAPGEIRVVPDPEAAQVYVVRLDTVTPADLDTGEAAFLAGIVGQQAAQGMATDLLNAFTQALQVEKGVQIDQSAINAVHAQFP